MGKLDTHNPIYCMKDDWDNWLNLRHTLNRMYMASIVEVQYVQIHLQNYDNEVM